jgi:hypothetical protein
MRKFDGVLYKEMNKEIKAAMITIRDKARGDVPIPYPSYLYGWEKGNKPSAAPVFNTGGRVRAFPLYDASEIKRGIVYRQGKSRVNRAGFAARFYVANNSAAGAIYETAGRKFPSGQPWVGPKGGGDNVSRSNNPDAGKLFIGAMGSLYGKGFDRGRLIFKAWAKNRGVAEGAAMKAIDKTTMQFEQRAKGNRLRSAA